MENFMKRTFPPEELFGQFKNNTLCGFNYLLIQKYPAKWTTESVDLMNRMVEWLKESRYHRLKRTPSKGIAKADFYNGWDFEQQGSAQCELVCTILPNWVFRFVIKSTVGPDGEAVEMTGRTGFLMVRRELMRYNIDITQFAVANGKDIKKTEIEPYFVAMSKWAKPGITYKKVNHIDFHSSFPGALAESHPEFRKPFEDIYAKRSDSRQNARLKIALDASIGFMQSPYCHLNGHGYALANLSRDAINGNNRKVRLISQLLEKSGRVPLLYNTDGIWYLGDPLTKGPMMGKAIGQWENDHLNCDFRIRSVGAYEYIEGGVYHPVYRGRSNYEEDHPRALWKWGEIFKAGEPITWHIENDKIIAGGAENGKEEK